VDNPCTTQSGQVLTAEIKAPDQAACQPQHGELAPDDLIQWTDDNGDLRWACLYRPPNATPATPLPLVVFIPGSESNVDTMYKATGLREKAATFDLTAGGHTGFFLAGVQARNMHGSNALGDGPKMDYSYRDLGTDTCNPDIRSIDHLIDQLAQDGLVDTSRIFIMGWSNGASFTQEYAVGRWGTPTRGGHRIAAAVAYAGADPFDADASTSNCGLATYPTSQVPIYNIHRSCDILVPCDASQQGPNTQNVSVEKWMVTLANQVMDPNGLDVIISTDATPVSACLAYGTLQCNQVVGLANHIHWPDGSNRDTQDWEPAMLGFLRAHPHP
jgi:poly(3-hydroxybutyrate) depolymerase